MKTTRVVLKKGDRTAILRGMVHVAPAGFYSLVQHETYWAINSGYRIFFEGVRDSQKEPKNQNEARIRKMFRLVFEFEKLFAKVSELSLQKIEYPSSAVNADIDLAEVSTLLDTAGYSCDELVLKMEAILKQENREKVIKRLLGDGNEQPLSFGNETLMTLVLVQHRNEHVVEEVRKHRGDFLIHYGEAHIPGIIVLMEFEGWRVVKFEEIDLGLFSL